MNEVIKTIYNRKSVRNFSQDAVAIEDLKIIAEAGVWAPNSMNAQEWHFTVVSNPTLVEKMRNACKKGMIEHDRNFYRREQKIRQTTHSIMHLQ
ncbi:MAG: nitroreductase family protein [Eubacterium sp.]